MVAHLMVASGNLRKGTRVDRLMRDLLGREPGTVPGQPEITREAPTLDPEQSVEYMAALTRALGGQDLRDG
jgi:hypothetical protein